MGHVFSINSPRVVHEIIDGEVIVIDLATGTYFSLQGAAADVWTLIDKGHSTEQMVSALAETSDDAATIRTTLDSFLDELRSEELVINGGANNATPQVAPALSLNGAFAPRLEKHTDMAELILLDPVHEVDSMGWPHRPDDSGGGA